MNCTSCKRPNHANRRFCGGCGHGLTPPCVACGFENERDDRFCGGCGERVAGAPAPALAPTPAPAPVVMKPVTVLASVPQRVTPMTPLDELSGLFDAPNTTRALPTAGIGQEDIDHLFGGGA